jgi:Uma2 family endonuclease
LDKHNVPQPDLVFIANNSRAIIDEEDAIIGSPDLIIEVVSPGSVKHDRVTKKDLYEQFAVKEYWVVDPKSQYVEIYTFENDRYRLHNLFDVAGQLITSPLLEGFSILFEKVFE